MTLTTMNKNVKTAQRNGTPPQTSDFGRRGRKLRSRAATSEGVRSRTHSLLGYAIILGATGLLTVILHFIASKVGEPLGLLYLYLLIVSLAALRWSIAHALFAVSLAMAAADFWVLPSPAGFRLNAEHGVLLIIFATIAIAQSLLQIHLKCMRRNLQERYQAVHQVAQVLQQALLPQPPDIPGYETAFRYEPAAHDAHMGGDFLDVFELGSGSVGLLIGDIAGHGVQASVQALKVGHLIRTFALQGLGPAECLATVNAAVCSDAGFAHFATVFFAILDTRHHVLQYATAGHEPGLLCPPRRGSIRRLHTGGMPIGITNAPINQYEESLLTMPPGMGLFLYTDGVTEARRQSSFYGLEGLERTLGMTTEESVEDPVGRLYDDVQQFAEGDLRDDVAMLWIRRREIDSAADGARPDDTLLSDLESSRGCPTRTEMREVSAVNV